MTASVVVNVLAWNGDAWLGPCLDSVLADPYPHRTVVVDNGSTDGSRALVAQRYPQVTLIENPRNEGFAGGHNVGIRAALRAGADYVVLLNQDIVAQPGWLGRLVDAGQRHPEIGVFAPLVLDYEGREIDPLCLRILALSPAYRRHRPPLAALEPLYEVGAAFAAALCVRAEVLRRVGLFDPLFFTYHEEGDFFQRARYHGVRTAVVTQSRIHHWHTGVRPDALSLKSRVLMARNSGLVRLKDPARSFPASLGAHARAVARGLARPGWKRRLLLLAVQPWVAALVPAILVKRRRERRGGTYVDASR
jgi:GT2 family glycosyltransferase